MLNSNYSLQRNSCRHISGIYNLKGEKRESSQRYPPGQPQRHAVASASRNSKRRNPQPAGSGTGAVICDPRQNNQMKRYMARLEQSINPRLKPPILFIKNGIRIFSDCNMSVYAGNATLFIVTAVFPFIMLIISIVNLLPGYSAKDVADILVQMLPDLDPVRELMGSIINNLKDQSGGLLASVAAVTTLWSASRGVSAIQKGLNQLNPKEANGGIKDIVKQLLITLL